MTGEGPKTIAILGGNTVSGLALSFLLRGVGYETKILKASPAGPEDLTEAVDLLLISPGLGDERRGEILAALRGTEGRLHVPVLAFSSAIEEGLFGDEAAGVTWPVEIGVLVREIEASLGGVAEIGPAIVTNPLVGEVALT
ncbi:hypothetical protein BH18ACT11_BH18ACT11_13570 [soil metagenome]